MNDIIFKIVLTIGVVFNLFGCIGLIRLPDVYNRLQSATKCVTLGTCSILLSLLIRHGISVTGFKVLIALPVLFFAATVAAHALVKGAYFFGVKMGGSSVIDEYANRSGKKTESKKNQKKEP